MSKSPMDPPFRFVGNRWFWIACVVSAALVVAAIGWPRYAIRQAKALPGLELSVFHHEHVLPGEKAFVRVYVNDGGPGRPIQGAEVKLSLNRGDSRTDLGVVPTDTHGFAQVARPLPQLTPGPYELRANASHGGLTASVAKSITVGAPLKTTVITDKPLYQPGQVIRIRTLSVDAHKRPAQNKDVVLEVKDAKGNKVFRKEHRTSSYGIAHDDFVLADQVNTGKYEVRALVAGTTTKREVRVERYVLPRFEVTVSTERGAYRSDRDILGEVRARYTFGQPVVGAEVRLQTGKAGTPGDPLAPIEPTELARGTTDATGTYRFEVPSKKVREEIGSRYSSSLDLSAVVTASAGGKQTGRTSVQVAKNILQVDAIPERNERISGVDHDLFVVAWYLDGRPARARVRLGDQEVETSELGVARARYDASESSLKLKASDTDGNTIHDTVYLPTDNAAEAFLLRPKQVILREGDTVTAEVISPSSSEPVRVDVVRSGRTLQVHDVPIENGRGTLSTKLPKGETGLMVLSAYRASPRYEAHWDDRWLYVHPRSAADGLEVAMKADRSRYRPGETAVLEFAVARPDGTPTPAALSLIGVDEAVLALAAGGDEPAELGAHRRSNKELPLSGDLLLKSPPAPSETVRVAQAAFLASLAENRSVSVERSKRYSSLQSSRASKVRRKTRSIGALGIVAPVALATLFALLLGIYAVRRIARPNPLIDEATKHVEALSRGVRRLMLTWAAAFYVPVLVLGGVVLIDKATRLIRVKDERLLQGGALLVLVAFVLLLIAARRFRRLRASEALPGLRKLVWGVPAAYGLTIVGLVLGILDDELRWRYLRNSYATGVYLVAGLFAFLLVGFLSAARASIGKELSWRRGLWLIVSRSLLAATGLFLAIGLTVAQRVGKGADDKMPTEQITEDFPDNREGGTGARAKSDPSAPPPGSKKRSSAVRVRRHFPETLLWRPEIITDQAGRARLELPLPDSITTWKIKSSTISKGGQLGDSVDDLRVFQEFFVDVEVPVALTQTDEITIPVSVYNYLPTRQTVRLEVAKAQWFEVLDGGGRNVDVGPAKTATTSFRIRAKSPGQQTLLVKASGQGVRDAIERTVRVEPYGQPTIQTINASFRGRTSQNVAIPDNAVVGATDLVLKVYPGPFSQVVEGLEGVFVMPRGCFEQTSSTTYPSVLALDFLRKAKRSSPSVESKALATIGVGYQRLLTFEVSGGGFSLYGRSPAKPVLSAYGLLEFHDMARVHAVDPDVITRTKRWLIDQQNEGTWGNVRNTAYIAWALGEVGDRSSELKRALDFLARPKTGKSTLYENAFRASALLAGGRKGEADKLLDAIAEQAVEADPGVYWKSSSEGVMYSRGLSMHVETTAIVARAMITSKRHVPLARRGLAWLVKQRGPKGVWPSTQATVAAMRALVADGRSYETPEQQRIAVLVNGSAAGEVQITEENRDVMQVLSLREYVREGPNVVELRGTGKTEVQFQLTAEHYVPWDAVPPPDKKKPMTLDVRYKTSEVRRGELLGCRVDVQWSRPNPARMVIVELGVPPGFLMRRTELDRLAEERKIERYTLIGRNLTLYFRDLEQGSPLSFEFAMEAVTPAKASAPRARAYPYYEPEEGAEARPVQLVVL